MARPRVFVSSSFSDLRHLRRALWALIDTFGFEPVMSEAGSIAYLPSAAPEQSCYREVALCDMLLLVVGGRYGTESGGATAAGNTREFYERYDSITKLEWEAAVRADIPRYVLVDRAVYGEYETYALNADESTVRYAHVDSVNVFLLIDLIRSQQVPILQFSAFDEIATWLREQWAGLFRELLKQRDSGRTVEMLNHKLTELGEVVSTLKTYLESLVTNRALITAESRRLKRARLENDLRNNELFRHLEMQWGISIRDFEEAVRRGSTLDDVVETIVQKTRNPALRLPLVALFKSSLTVVRELNAAREAMSLKPAFGPIPNESELDAQ